jgi:hypothetical protein
MSPRAIDICTCGHARSEHRTDTGECLGGSSLIAFCTCQDFMPHPQPPVFATPAFQEKLLDFLHASGYVRLVADKMFVELLNGETWEIQATLRRSKTYTRDGV